MSTQPFDIRTLEDAEIATFLTTVGTALSFVPRDQDIERMAKVVPAERTFGAFAEGAMVGGGGTYPFTLTVPGGEIGAGGITLVGVLPSHRRKGILTRVMRSQLEDCRAHDEALAILWASEGPIYQRYGFGLAIRKGEIDLERDRARFLHPTEPIGRHRLIELEESMKVLPDIYERVRRSTPGMFQRSLEWWEFHRLYDAEDRRDGGTPMWRAVWEHEGRAEAYALYRLHPSWPDGIPSGWLEMIELVASSPQAAKEMWRFVFGVDLVARIRAEHEPVDSPLFFLLDDPRRLRFRISDAVWLRIVDVDAALTARTYNGDGILVFELGDALLPENAGRWRLEVRDGVATCKRTSEEPDLELSIAELGTVYLGGAGFTELHAARRVRENRRGAALRATTLFATERAPWCPEMF